MSDSSSQRTGRAAQRGDPEALEALVRRCRPQAYRIAYAVTGDPRAAEDVAQESVLAAIRSLDTFDRRRRFRALAAPDRRQSSCRLGTPSRPPCRGTSAFLQPPGAEPSAPGIFFGILQPDEPPIATVRVVFEPRSGSERQLESELIDVSDRSFDSLGENASGRIFVSVIDGELVAQELRGKARIYAAARDGGGDEVARAALHDPLDVVALRDLLERELPQDLEPNEVSRLLGISGREVEEALPTGRLNSHSLRRTLERLLVARARSRRG